MNQRERDTVKGCRTHAQIIRRNARWWDEREMHKQAARAYQLADELTQKADAIEKGELALAEGQHEEAA